MKQELPIGEDGYVTIERKWKKGDQVTLSLEMQPRLVKANDKVEADKNQVCIQRGPIVYCAEWADNDFNIQSMLLNQQPAFEVTPTDFTFKTTGEKATTFHHTLKTITTDAQALSFDESGRLVTRDVRLKLIPYYAWAHRGKGNMRVWLPIHLKL